MLGDGNWTVITSLRAAALRRSEVCGEDAGCWAVVCCRLALNMSMDSELQKHYAQLLGIGSPWEVKTVELKLVGKSVPIKHRS